MRLSSKKAIFGLMWVWLIGVVTQLAPPYSMLQSLAKYPVRYSRTLDHLLSWRFLLPEGIKEAVISFQSSNRDHEGTM